MFPSFYFKKLYNHLNFSALIKIKNLAFFRVSLKCSTDVSLILPKRFKRKSYIETDALLKQKKVSAEKIVHKKKTSFVKLLLSTLLSDRKSKETEATQPIFKCEKYT